MGGKFVTRACSLILPLFESKDLARFSASTHARTLKILVKWLVSSRNRPKLDLKMMSQATKRSRKVVVSKSLRFLKWRRVL